MSRNSRRASEWARQAGTMLVIALLAGGALFLYNWMIEAGARAPK